MTTNEILLSLLTGCISGVLAAYLWYRLYISYQKNHWKYKKLAGIYNIRSKYACDTNNYGTLSIKVNGNYLVTKSLKSKSDFWEGVITMDTDSKNSGKGFYEHIENENILWGYNEIQITDKGDILVHNSYADKDCKLIVKGYRWEKNKH